MVQRDDDGHQQVHARPRQKKTSLHANHQIGVEIALLPEDAQRQLRLLVHQAKQHAAQQALRRVPFQGAKGQERGRRRRQLGQHRERLEGIPFL